MLRRQAFASLQHGFLRSVKNVFIYNFVTSNGVWENVYLYNIETYFLLSLFGRCYALLCHRQIIYAWQMLFAFWNMADMKTFSTDLRKPYCKLVKAWLLSINLVLFLIKSIYCIIQTEWETSISIHLQSLYVFVVPFLVTFIDWTWKEILCCFVWFALNHWLHFIVQLWNAVHVCVALPISDCFLLWIDPLVNVHVYPTLITTSSFFSTYCVDIYFYYIECICVRHA